MKKLFYLFVVAIITCFTACHRNYKVIHARAAVDTTLQTDNEQSKQPTFDDSPLIDIPDMPQEDDLKDVSDKDRQDYENFMKGVDD